MQRTNDKDARKEQIVQAALAVARREGFDKVHKVSVAEEAKVADSLIYHYFKSMDDVRKAVMCRAVHAATKKDIPIVAAGIGRGYRAAKNAPLIVKDAAIKHLVG